MSLFTSGLDDPDLVERRNRSSRIPDLAYGIVLPMGGLTIPGFYVMDLATIAMLGIALMRRPRFHLPLGTLLLLAGLGLELFISGELNGGALAVRRLGHIGIWALLIIAVGQGRINVMSLARGIGIGILVAVPLSLPSLVSGGYAGRLTGLFGDPNTAGMILVTLGPWTVGIVRGRLRWLVGLLVTVGVVLTFSRTSLLAFSVALIWVALSRRLSMWFTAALIAPIAVLGSPWLEAVRLFGPFEARTGSDLLRGRIADAAAAKLATTPWYGNGPGTATVEVLNTRFFLHSTYDSLLIEGGWLAMTFMVALLALAFFRAATGPHAQRRPWFEAGLIAGLVCGLSLGEVLFEMQLAATIGALLLVGSVQRRAAFTDFGLPWAVADTHVLPATRSIDDDDFIRRIQDDDASLSPAAQPALPHPPIERVR